MHASINVRKYQVFSLEGKLPCVWHEMLVVVDIAHVDGGDVLLRGKHSAFSLNSLRRYQNHRKGYKPFFFLMLELLKGEKKKC